MSKVLTLQKPQLIRCQNKPSPIFLLLLAHILNHAALRVLKYEALSKQQNFITVNSPLNISYLSFELRLQIASNDLVSL